MLYTVKSFGIINEAIKRKEVVGILCFSPSNFWDCRFGFLSLFHFWTLLVLVVITILGGFYLFQQLSEEEFYWHAE